MKYLFSCFAVIGLITGVRADMPGNKPREEVTVRVIFGELQGYTIYSWDDYSSDFSGKEVKDSSEHILQGGFGAPPCITFFGVNSKGKHTDSITICNEEQGSVQLKLSVQQDKLVQEQITLKQNTTAGTINKDDTEDKSSWTTDHKVTILVMVALTAMVLLTGIYFMKQRKKQTA